MSLTALQLAEYTIRRAAEKETPITNLKLQKTLYYIQGYSIRLHLTKRSAIGSMARSFQLSTLPTAQMEQLPYV